MLGSLFRSTLSNAVDKAGENYMGYGTWKSVTDVFGAVTGSGKKSGADASREKDEEMKRRVLMQGGGFQESGSGYEQLATAFGKVAEPEETKKGEGEMAKTLTEIAKMLATVVKKAEESAPRKGISMKTRTTLTGVLVLLARPFLDALRDECSVWREHGSYGGEVRNTPAAVDREATLEPSPAAMPEPVMNISFMTAAEHAPVALTEPVLTFSVTTPAEALPTATPAPAVEPVAVATPASAAVEPATSVAVPEPVFTITAQAKREPKPAKRTRKPATTKSAARTSAKSRKPAPRSKRSPVCSSA
jgi:hypothetical protein